MRFVQTIWHRLEEGIIALLLCFMTLLTFVQVVLRYGFNSGFLWAQEATLYAFGWLVLVGLAYGLRRRAHLGIDLVVRRLPVPARRAVGLLAIACCLLFVGLMVWGSLVYVEKLYDVGVEAEDLPIERWMLNSALPIGFTLFGIRLLTEAYRILTGRADGFEIADEAGDALREHAPPPVLE